MTASNLRKFLIPALLLVVVGCQLLHPYGRPDTATTGHDRDVATTDTTTLASRPWQQLFTDPALQKLIAEGLANNRNLQVANARIAQALLAQSRAAFLPSLTGRASTTLSRVGGAFVSTATGGGGSMGTTTGGTTGGSTTGGTTSGGSTTGGTTTGTTTDQSTIITGGAAYQYLLGLSSSWEADVGGSCAAPSART